MTREQWLAERKNGIGASDAACILGMSPYKTNFQLWEEKTGRREPKDISDSPFVKYGIEAEPHIRALFALDYPQYMVYHEEYQIIRNPDYPFIFATPDGELSEMDNSSPLRLVVRSGGLEIKTTEIQNAGQWAKWKDQVPENYYIQVLHQFLATGWSFDVLRAHIKSKYKRLSIQIRDYVFEKTESVQADMQYLLAEEIKFWKHVQDDTPPPLKFPPI